MEQRVDRCAEGMKCASIRKEKTGALCAHETVVTGFRRANIKGSFRLHTAVNVVVVYPRLFRKEAKLITTVSRIKPVELPYAFLVSNDSVHRNPHMRSFRGFRLKAQFDHIILCHDAPPYQCSVISLARY